MSKFFGAPVISPHELKRRMQRSENFVLLDVREDNELTEANLRDWRVVRAPRNRLRKEGIAALPTVAQNKDAEIVVYCHVGDRSAKIGAWLQSLGWRNVRSLDGGLEAYAQQIDTSVGSY
jgi:sulfur-carrier protein adenylyltransferase/sulfurtransferase